MTHWSWWLLSVLCKGERYLTSQELPYLWLKGDTLLSPSKKFLVGLRSRSGRVTLEPYRRRGFSVSRSRAGGGQQRALALCLPTAEPCFSSVQGWQNGDLDGLL